MPHFTKKCLSGSGSFLHSFKSPLQNKTSPNKQKARVTLTLQSSPLDKGGDLFENKRRGPFKAHGLLGDGVISHEKAVRMDDQDTHKIRSHKE